MKKVEWVTEDIFFDEHGRLHILNPRMVRRIKELKHVNAVIEVNQSSIIVGPIPIPGPRNPTCPDAMCVCTPPVDWLKSPVEKSKATKTGVTKRTRKPTAGL